VVIAIVAVVLVLVGAGAAWKLLGHKTGRDIAGPHASVSAAGPVSESAAAGSVPSPAAQAPSAGGPVAVTATASQQSSAPQVATFLAAYFQAINTRDYNAYLALFEPGLRPTYQQFQNGYGSTSDSDATLSSIVATATGVAAEVTFTSHQLPAGSPTGTSCTAWDITLYLQPQGRAYWIVPAPAGYHARYEAC
jgi:hypothetical protein